MPYHLDDQQTSFIDEQAADLPRVAADLTIWNSWLAGLHLD